LVITAAFIFALHHSTQGLFKKTLGSPLPSVFRFLSAQTCTQTAKLLKAVGPGLVSGELLR
jgi:hypothetical protein